MRPLSIVLWPAVLWPAMVALLLPTLAAQPTIRQVVNAVSEIPPPLPGSWLAQGARFLVRGTNLGPGTVVTSETPLPNLGGVSVRIAHRGTEWNAPLIEVGPTQIEAIMPAQAPAGDITVEVIHHGAASRPTRARLAQQTLGLYSTLQRSYGPALEGPVSRGDRVTLRGTGLGPKPKPDAIEIFIASRKAPVLRAAPSESEPGIDEIEIQIPRDAPTGCSVPVQARLLGRIPSNTVTLSIEANRDDCPALMDAQQALASGGATGYALLTRLAPEVLAGDNYIFRFAAEHLSTGFLVRQGFSGPIGPLLHLPPAGSCASYTSDLDPEQAAAANAFATDRPLSAGREIVIRGKAGERSVTPKAGGGMFANRLGGEWPAETELLPLFLHPGKFMVTGKKGDDVGAFSASVQVPEPVHCKNCETGRSVDRGRPFRVEWRGGDGDTLVTVAGGNIDRRNDAVAFFLCTAKRGRQSMRIPAHVLQTVPATPSDKSGVFGFLATGIGLDPAPVTFQADGLNFGLALALNVGLHEVRYR